MRFYIHVLIFLLLGASSLHFLAAQPTENALLWQVTGKGLSQPSYLYGTIHMICPDDLVMPKTVESKFSNTQQLYLEMDMDDVGMLMKMMMPKTQRMKDNGSLKKMLPANDYKYLDKFFKDSLGKNLKSFDKTKPLFTLSAMYPKMLDCGQPASYEVEFLKMAKEQKKEVLGLESLDAQLEAADAIPYKDQAKQLVEMARDFQKSRQAFLSMVEAYKTQNINAFTELMKEEEEKSEGFEQAMLTTRNKSWIPVIEKASAQKSTFYAFGAAHLIGDNGVVQLLRKAGYTVSPVK